MNKASKLPEGTSDRGQDDLARKEYLEGLNADYKALHADPAGWADFCRDVAAWDVTNMDGLERS
jgi:hypothetical protein